MSNLFHCQNYDTIESSYNKHYAPYDDESDEVCYNCDEIIKDIDLITECPHCEEAI